ncbi:hypothetical protein [Rhizobium sp. 11515TR]|uniref:hypothetical protein n=1 Tax=unclassified Rhizobium TaxID=2613769 RepID=UPI000BA87EC9|nr:hypothetical protein [Rhizobium sp. 11515TR]ASW10220.1 hypothetical protein CKA34_30080 [Rhizobium sp. 11515TR]
MAKWEANDFGPESFALDSDKGLRPVTADELGRQIIRINRLCTILSRVLSAAEIAVTDRERIWTKIEEFQDQNFKAYRSLLGHDAANNPQPALL